MLFLVISYSPTRVKLVEPIFFEIITLITKESSLFCISTVVLQFGKITHAHLFCGYSIVMMVIVLNNKNFNNNLYHMNHTAPRVIFLETHKRKGPV